MGYDWNNNLIDRESAKIWAISGEQRLIDGERWVKVDDVKRKLDLVLRQPKESEIETCNGCVREFANSEICRKCRVGFSNHYEERKEED